MRRVTLEPSRRRDSNQGLVGNNAWVDGHRARYLGLSGIRAGLVVALVGCTSTLAPRPDSPTTSPAPPATSTPTPAATSATTEPSCAPQEFDKNLYGELDDPIACPGTATTLRIRGFEPAQGLEVWQGPADHPPRCNWHPRDAQGVRLGEARSDELGGLAFPFTVAESPGGPEATRALWLVPSNGSPAVQAVVWTCARRTRLSGRLYDEDHAPYLRSARIEARFYADTWGTRRLVAERTVTAENGQYALDDVPLPTSVELQAYDGDWPIATATQDREGFLNQWGDEATGGRLFGSPGIVDFGGPPNATLDRYQTRMAITRWDRPAGLASAPPPAKNPLCPWQRPDELPVFGDGQIDNDLACTEGDTTRFRARGLPANSRFEVWQSQSTRVKFMCWPHPQEFNGVNIADATSDADGNFSTTVKLRSIRHDDYDRETTLWLVYPDGVTTDLVVTWACTRPSRLSGKLYGDDGKPFLGPVRVEVRAQLPNRVLRLTTEAVGGAYTIEDAPAPVDYDLVVYQGERRLAERHVRRHELTEGAWGRSWRTPGLLPAQGEPFTLDFGGPGGEADPNASYFPLWTDPTPGRPQQTGSMK